MLTSQNERHYTVQINLIKQFAQVSLLRNIALIGDCLPWEHASGRRDSKIIKFVYIRLVVWLVACFYQWIAHCMLVTTVTYNELPNGTSLGHTVRHLMATASAIAHP